MGLPRLRQPATRQEVLTAARDVFEEVGYARASLPAIAERAGLSAAGLSETFADKAELLDHVLTEGYGALDLEFDRAAGSARGTTLERLQAILRSHHDVEARRTRLFLTLVGGPVADPAWRRLTAPGADPRLRGVLVHTLRSGQGRKEVRPEADLDAFVDLLLAIYAWNYRQISTTAADTPRLIALMDRQLALLFASVAAAL